QKLLIVIGHARQSGFLVYPLQIVFIGCDNGYLDWRVVENGLADLVELRLQFLLADKVIEPAPNHWGGGEDDFEIVPAARRLTRRAIAACFGRANGQLALVDRAGIALFVGWSDVKNVYFNVGSR